MSQLLTVSEAAPMLRKTAAATRMWLRSRDCPIELVRIGRRVFIRREDIDALIEGRDHLPLKAAG